MTRIAASFGLMLLVSAPAVAGDREAFRAGVKLLREGKARVALAKLKEAELSWQKHDEEIPEALLADLALAAWRSKQPGEAEGYAERAAARASRFGFLRDTIVGAARLAEAQKALLAKEPKALEAGIESAKRAIRSFEDALARRPAVGEAARNLERAIHALEALEKRKKESKKKNDKKKDKKDKDKKKGDKKKGKPRNDKKSPKKPDEKKQKKQKKPDEKKPDEKKGNKKKEKPKPSQAPKPSQGKPKPAQKKKGKRELTPEETKRLLRALAEIQKRKLQMRKDSRPRHVPGKKDW